MLFGLFTTENERRRQAYTLAVIAADLDCEPTAADITRALTARGRGVYLEAPGAKVIVAREGYWAGTRRLTLYIDDIADNLARDECIRQRFWAAVIALEADADTDDALTYDEIF